jgi:hypothetical protein
MGKDKRNFFHLIYKKICATLHSLHAKENYGGMHSCLLFSVYVLLRLFFLSRKDRKRGKNTFVFLILRVDSGLAKNE